MVLGNVHGGVESGKILEDRFLILKDGSDHAMCFPDE